MLARPRLRLALVSTPRSGNTWLCHLLQRVWGLYSRAVHRMTDDDWRVLPDECVLQIHHLRTPEFEDRLEREGFRVVTMARHPFDVLISILHVEIYGVEAENWLEGQHGDETCLWGMTPCNRAFLEYAVGPRARALLDVTSQWAERPGTVFLKYEDLVRDPGGQLERLVTHFGPPTGEPIADAVAATTLEQMRRTTRRGNHFWMGQPGLWRHLLPAEQAGVLEAAHHDRLKNLGYAADADESLTASQADANWARCFGVELRASLNRATDLHQEDLAAMERRLEESHQAMLEWEQHCLAIGHRKNEFERELNETHVRLRQALKDVEAARYRLGLIDGCGRTSLRAARWVQAVLDRAQRLRLPKIGFNRGASAGLTE